MDRETKEYYFNAISRLQMGLHQFSKDLALDVDFDNAQNLVKYHLEQFSKDLVRLSKLNGEENEK